MARVLAANVWVDGRLYSAGSSDVPADVAERIGDHAWEAVAEAADEPALVVDAEPSPPESGESVEDAPPDAAADDESAPVEPEEDDVDVSPVAVDEPPRAGRGSSRDAWVTYAGSVGVSVTEDMSRDDVIAAVDAAVSGE